MYEAKRFNEQTCAFRSTSFSSFFSPWGASAFRQRFPSILITPLPVRVSPEMSLLDLKHRQHDKQTEQKNWKINKPQTCNDTWKARSWYFCFSLAPRAYHHSPRILLTVRLSWFGCLWCTKARWRLLKIINAFIGRRMWSFSLCERVGRKHRKEMSINLRMAWDKKKIS